MNAASQPDGVANAQNENTRSESNNGAENTSSNENNTSNTTSASPNTAPLPNPWAPGAGSYLQYVYYIKLSSLDQVEKSLSSHQDYQIFQRWNQKYESKEEWWNVACPGHLFLV